MSDPTPSLCPFVCMAWADAMRGCDLPTGHVGPHVDHFGGTHGTWGHRDSDQGKAWLEGLDRAREEKR